MRFRTSILYALNHLCDHNLRDYLALWIFRIKYKCTRKHTDLRQNSFRVSSFSGITLNVS